LKVRGAFSSCQGKLGTAQTSRGFAPSRFFLRLLAAHGLAYVVAAAWAFGSIPLIVMHVASAGGLSLDEHVMASRVLAILAWPSIGAFVLEHLAGVAWGLAGDPPRGRRPFLVGTAVLFGVPAVVGGVSWIWLVSLP
jgi:hypothetical protein